MHLFSIPQKYIAFLHVIRFFLGPFSKGVPCREQGIKKPQASCLILRFGKTCCHKQESPRYKSADVSLLLVATLKFPDSSITKKSENAFAIYLFWFFFGSNSLYCNNLS